MQEPGKRCAVAFKKKSRTVRSLRLPEKFFVKIPGKISGEIVLGKIWWSGLSLELKFSRMEFRGE